MRISTWLIFGICTAVSLLAYAGGGNWQPLRAKYLIHSETATYPEAPTRVDRVLTVAIDGQGAKELFEQIGPTPVRPAVRSQVIERGAQRVSNATTRPN